MELRDTKKFSRMLFCGIQIHNCSWKDGIQQHNNLAIAYSENHGTIKYGIAQGFFLTHGSVCHHQEIAKARHDLIKNAKPSSLGSSSL